MKVLILADPINSLLPASDTGLSLARKAIDRGHEVYWGTDRDILLADKQIFFEVAQIIECNGKELPTRLEAPNLLPGNNFDCIWVRKDPPFDQSYLSMCWKLKLLEDTVTVLNPVNALVSFHEKLLPLHAVVTGFMEESQVLGSYVGEVSKLARIADIHQKIKSPFILKPWLGHGGRGVELVEESVSEYAKKFARDELQTDQILQNFISEISVVGDRRVIFIDGEYVGDFVRLPAKNSILANLSQGGRAETRDLNPELERSFAGLGRFLKANNIFLAGADYIGDFLSEVNITAPTGFETLKELNGTDLSEIFVKKVEELVHL